MFPEDAKVDKCECIYRSRFHFPLYISLSQSRTENVADFLTWGTTLFFIGLDGAAAVSVSENLFSGLKRCRLAELAGAKRQGFGATVNNLYRLFCQIKGRVKGKCLKGVSITY
jgi:hypothetical protein